MTASPPRTQPGSEQEYLEDNIATVAFHLGQPGAILTVDHKGPGLVVYPGEVLAEISRRLATPAQPAGMREAIARIIAREVPALRRVDDGPGKRAMKIADAILAILDLPASPAGMRDWSEDASHENGNYENRCCECDQMFIGHKRRVICKACSNLLRAALPAERPADAQTHAQRSELDDASNACLELAAKHGYATGHGDTVADMIREFSAQITGNAQAQTGCDKEAAFGEDGYNPAYDDGITFAIIQLAELTGSKDWQMRDGSEDHDTDVRNTIMDVLKCAGLYDDETDNFARFKPTCTCSVSSTNHQRAEDRRMKLFDEPFDLDKIERALHDDNFLSLAHFCVGREAVWRAGLDQVAELIPLFEEAGRDSTPVYAMASILMRRTSQLSEPAKFLAEVTTKLGLLPASAANYRRPSLSHPSTNSGGAAK